jgi:hypothetical protein
MRTGSCAADTASPTDWPSANGALLLKNGRAPLPGPVQSTACSQPTAFEALFGWSLGTLCITFSLSCRRVNHFMAFPVICYHRMPFRGGGGFGIAVYEREGRSMLLADGVAVLFAIRECLAATGSVHSSSAVAGKQAFSVRVDPVAKRLLIQTRARRRGPDHVS